MSKPYDAAAKELFEADPAGWAALLGVTAPPECIHRLDTDLSATSAAADEALWVGADPPYVLNVEFQSGRDPTAPRQLHKYFALLHERHEVPVRSALVVLAPDANSRAYTGAYSVDVEGRRVLDFRYDVVKVWELAHAALLAGPSLGLLPLAPVADVPPADAEAVFRLTADRLLAETPAQTADKLFTAMGFLLRLRYGNMAALDWLNKYPNIMEELPFSAFVDKGQVIGAVREARAMVLRQGRKKFGEPTSEQVAALDAVTELAALEALGDRLLDVSTWTELLTPTPPGPQS